VDGKCIYIDTEGSFRTDRVSEIANARGFNSDLVLENIIINQPLNSETQELVVERSIPKVLAQSTDKRIKLIIVASPITHYKTEYPDLSERSSKLQKLFRFMSQSYGLAIVVTNHASTIPDSNLVADTDIKKPAGGNAIGYASTYILYLKDGPQIGCKAVLLKCPFEPKGSAIFTIDKMGVALHRIERPDNLSNLTQLNILSYVVSKVLCSPSRTIIRGYDEKYVMSQQLQIG
jgi:DNA repair protein RadA